MSRNRTASSPLRRTSKFGAVCKKKSRNKKIRLAWNYFWDCCALRCTGQENRMSKQWPCIILWPKHCFCVDLGPAHAGVPQTLSAFCLHAYCVNLMQFLGRSSSAISGEHLPPNGEVLAQWSSQGEEHAHAVRKRTSAGGVRRTQRYAWIARAGLEHRALGPCRLARVFFKQ